MVYRVFLFILIISCCLSCSYFSDDGKNSKPKLDTVVDFTTVDVSPGFKECEQLLDDEKTECFRTTIRQHFTDGLHQNEFSSDEDIKETIVLVLRINDKGKMTLKQIKASDDIQQRFPELKSLLNQIVRDIPDLFPATKRGIPVTTEYQLPIEIQTQE
ncbi:hypothetical protein [Tenacibaculum sp. 190524A05c]|uniref:hypothetical protein n=1 Tax=Tenacibaculum platacis TaxID=3137852 RepID=UPI0031FB3E6F